MKCSSTFILVLFSNLLLSQSIEEVPTLRQELNRTLSVQRKIEIWTDLAYVYADIQLDTAEAFINKAYDFKESIKDPLLLARVISRKGLILQRQGKSDQGLKLLHKGLKIRKNEKAIGEVGRSFIDIGNTYSFTGESLLDVDDSVSQANFEIALDYYKRARGAFIRMKDTNQEAYALYCIGRVHYQLYEDDLAIAMYKRALQLFINQNNPDGITKSAKGLALLYDYIEERDSALVYQKLLSTYPETTPRLQLKNALSKADLFRIQGKQDSALVFLQQADTLSLTLSDDNVRKVVLKNLSEAHGSIGNTEGELIYLKQYQSLYQKIVRDSLVNNQTAIHYRQQSIDSQKREQDQKLKNETQAKFLYAFGGSSLFLLTGFLWYFNTNKKNRQIEYEKNEKLIKEVELKSIQNLIKTRDDERKRISEDLHDHLGNTLMATRYLFEANLINGAPLKEAQIHKMYSMLDKAINETRTVAHSMQSEVLQKFGLEAALVDLKNTIHENGSLKVHLVCEKPNKDEGLNGELELNLYRIVQELVTNVLKYAAASELNISLIRTESVIEVVVMDNGVGFDTSKLNIGMGLKNIEARVLKCKGEWEYTSKPGYGTRTTIKCTPNGTD